MRRSPAVAIPKWTFTIIFDWLKRENWLLHLLSILKSYILLILKVLEIVVQGFVVSSQFLILFDEIIYVAIPQTSIVLFVYDSLLFFSFMRASDFTRILISWQFRRREEDWSVLRNIVIRRIKLRLASAQMFFVFGFTGTYTDGILARIEMQTDFHVNLYILLRRICYYKHEDRIFQIYQIDLIQQQLIIDITSISFSVVDLQNDNNYYQITMFAKFSQIKHFISQAITSLESQKPKVPSDPFLDNKLKFMLDYVLKNPTAQQFKAYHELQSPEMQLNQLLSQIYHSSTSDTTQITSIIHFFTFLLINCSNELVTYKIISTKLVIEMTEVYLDRVQSSANNKNIDFQEVNSYKIALIKAYVSRIDTQTIKYMIIKDKMAILENCVATYELYIEHEQEQQLGVEVTCIANSILKIIHFLAEHPEHAPSLNYHRDEKGITYLLVGVVKNIHSTILILLKSQKIDQDILERLESRIMLLVDMVESITQEQYRREIIQATYKELSDFRQLFEEIVVQYTLKQASDAHQYLKSLQLIRVLLKLLTIYFQSHQLVSIFQNHLLPLMKRFVTFLQCSLNLLQLPAQSQQQKLFQLRQKVKIVNFMCINMQILNMILSNGGYLKRKAINTQQQKKMKVALVNTIVDIIQLILSQQTHLQELICLKSIKFMLQALMQLTLQNKYTLHEYSVLKLHLYCINNLRELLKRSQDWNYVVMHYESLTKNISDHLLSNQSHNSIQYSHCQFHDPLKRRVISSCEAISNAILVNECMRNFRFIIVEKTYININDIKLQKTYHTNFISPGWQMSPGSLIEDSEVVQVCHLVHILNGVRIPIVVIEDEDCLIFAVVEEGGRRVVANIRYKMIMGFSFQQDVIHVQLKGAQQVLVEPHKNNKQSSTKFRQYIINKRDLCRQRELKFIHHYLDIYYQDNMKIIREIGQLDIQPVSPTKATLSQVKTQHSQNQTIIVQKVDQVKPDLAEPVETAQEE